MTRPAWAHDTLSGALARAVQEHPGALTLHVDNAFSVKPLECLPCLAPMVPVITVESDHPGQVRIREGPHESRRRVWFRVMRGPYNLPALSPLGVAIVIQDRAAMSAVMGCPARAEWSK